MTLWRRNAFKLTLAPRVGFEFCENAQHVEENDPFGHTHTIQSGDTEVCKHSLPVTKTWRHGSMLASNPNSHSGR